MEYFTVMQWGHKGNILKWQNEVIKGIFAVMQWSIYDLFNYLTIYLSDYLTVWLWYSSDCLTIWLSDYLTIWLSDYWTIWLSNYLTIWLSDYLTIWLSDYLTIWLSDYLTLWLSQGSNLPSSSNHHINFVKREILKFNSRFHYSREYGWKYTLCVEIVLRLKMY